MRSMVLKLTEEVSHKIAVFQKQQLTTVQKYKHQTVPMPMFEYKNKAT